MAGNTREPSATEKIAHSSTREVIMTGALALALILFFVALGVALQQFLSYEFIGDQTKLIHMCKKDPKSNPKLCAELLAERTGTSRAGARALRGSIPPTKFQLSDDKDADLRPPPDMIK